MLMPDNTAYINIFLLTKVLKGFSQMDLYMYKNNVEVGLQRIAYKKSNTLREQIIFWWKITIILAVLKYLI